MTSARTLFLVATGAWFLAFGMQSVVFAWLVTMVLREPAELVGWAQTAMLAPGMALILIAGAMADRLGSIRQAMTAQIVAALAPWILVVAVLESGLSYGVMIVYALIMGTAQAFVTPARDGLLNLVAGDSVQRTVLLASLVQFSGQIVGYFIAGYADSVGAVTVLIAQSAFLVLGVVAYALMRKSNVADVPQGKAKSVLGDMLEGARTVLSSATMRVIVIQNVAMALFFMGSFIVCFPLVVREVFAGSSSDLALLNVFNAIGLVATIAIMLKLGVVHRPGRAFLLSQGIGALVLLASGFMQNFLLFVVAIFVWGLCGGMAMPMSRTLMQELAPAGQRSRVMSFYAFSFMGAGPLGTVLCGYLAASFGPQNAIVICGSAMLVVVILISAMTRLWSEEVALAQV